MEFSGELLPGVSLESVVEKASELERVLRGCKNAAVREKVSTPPFQEGRGHTPSEINTRDLSSPNSEADGNSTGLNTHWHQLSTYIVGLEKEIQYYKQLVDDNQRAAVAAGGHASAQPERHHTLHQSRPRYISPHKSEVIFAADNEFWTQLMESQYALWLLINDDVMCNVIFPPEDRECRILLAIFGHLTTAEVCKVGRVCRKWYTLSKHPNLWRRIDISEAVITSQVILMLLIH